MSDPTPDPTAEAPAASPDSKTAKPGGVSREFIWIVALVVLIAVGALGFKGWQKSQQGPDLDFAMDFIKTLESPNPPHLKRLAINGQVAAFYKENGPVKSVMSHDLDRRLDGVHGDPVYQTKTMVLTSNGPVLVHIRVIKHLGQPSILSFSYEPQS